MTGKLDGLTDRMRARMTEARLGNLDRDNVRLRGEVAVLRSELDHERSEREELRDLLRAKPKTVKVRGKRSMLRVVVIGAGAYVLGARAGRERYDEILAWARSLARPGAGPRRRRGRGDGRSGASGGHRNPNEGRGDRGGSVRDRAATAPRVQVEGSAREAGDRVDLTRSELQAQP